MFKKFKPTWQIESIYDLDVAELKRHNISAILSDLDNTLIAWNNPYGTDRLKVWLQRMEKAHIQVIVISNNKKKRIELALNNLKLPFVWRALKPLSFGVKLALKYYNLEASRTVLVGDQLMTDILAANNAKIRSVLVKPLVRSDAWSTKVNRFMESKIKKHLEKNGELKRKWAKSLDD